ncbi:hypothetical protein [Bradyrhizobium erythrophlei]|uniref:Uncharacterized protein n=1 Tax=Bradyrhizobium erythrophlei TaxID=1437360 RepID=A0A1H4Y9A2_9BRAD|nr:hypothetical protein [Bradyrhizobium erythrophlei]SED13741.1 hypothetical protein SAMN05444164_3817 [Bradyrhizobium erythrophlei]
MNFQTSAKVESSQRQLPFECVALVLQGGGALGQDLYSALHAWLHRVPGGLGVANILARSTQPLLQAIRQRGGWIDFANSGCKLRPRLRCDGSAGQGWEATRGASFLIGSAPISLSRSVLRSFS